MDPLLWLVHGPTLSSLMSPPSPPSCSVLSSNSDRDTKSDLDPLCFMLQYISVQALANHCRTRTRHSPVRCTSCCVDPFSTLLVCHPQAVQGASCTRPQTLHDMSCTGRAGCPCKQVKREQSATGLQAIVSICASSFYRPRTVTLTLAKRLVETQLNVIRGGSMGRHLSNLHVITSIETNVVPTVYAYLLNRSTTVLGFRSATATTFRNSCTHSGLNF
jgi:hypothetical protein